MTQNIQSSKIATLTFDLNDIDAKNDFELMIKSNDLYFAIRNIYDRCRQKVKYENEISEVHDFCEELICELSEYIDLLT